MEGYKIGKDCKKCGERKVTTKFKPKGQTGYDEHGVWGHLKKDLIERFCTNCSHIWLELPLDAKELKDEGKS